MQQQEELFQEQNPNLVMVEDLPEGDLELTGDEDELGEFAYDIGSKTLVADFMLHPEGVKELKSLAMEVCKKFDAAYDGSRQYREKSREVWDLFRGVLPPKPAEYKHLANAHVPIAIENLSRVYLRAHGELFGDFTKPFAAVPVRTDPGALEEARIVTRHTNWQLRTQIRDFERQTHRLTLGYFTTGDLTVHSHFDEMLQCNRHEVLTPDEFVTPYTYVSVMPDYSDVPFRVRVHEYYRHDLERMRDKWENIDKVLKREPAWTDEPEQPIGDGASEDQGVEKPLANDIQAPYKVLRYEGWTKMPDIKDEVFMCIIVEYQTQTVLKMYPHTYPDPEDQIRYDMQLQEREMYRPQLELYLQETESRAAAIEQARAAHAEGLIGDQMLADGEAFAAEQLPQPPAPSWMQDPMNADEEPPPVKQVPIHFFTHVVCLEPFAGSLGISYGRVQADLNIAANVLLSQTVDSASFANLSHYLVDQGLEFVGGDVVMKPGGFTKVNGVIDDLQKQIFPMKLAPANPQLVELINLIFGWAQSSMQSPNVLSGESGKSGETRGGLIARIEQATKQLSVLTRKLASSVENVYRNNCILNSMYLPEEELVRVTEDLADTEEPMRITREIYAQKYDWKVVADLRFTPDEMKVAEANEAFQLLGSTLPIHQNPVLVWHALVKLLKAKGLTDIVRMMMAMGPPKPQPMAPPGAPPGGPGAPQPGAKPPQGKKPKKPPAGPGGPPQKPPGPQMAPGPQPPAPGGE